MNEPFDSESAAKAGKKGGRPAIGRQVSVTLPEGVILALERELEARRAGYKRVPRELRSLSAFVRHLIIEGL